MARVVINGLGRIGRATLKVLLDTPELELAALNDIGAPENIAYLLKYDTVYGRYERSVEAREDGLAIDGKEYPLFRERDPAKLPWGKLGVDLVFECTGVFTRKEDLAKHLQTGAHHVILSAPSKSPELLTVVYGVDRHANGHAQIVSCASCTTNCITPVVEIVGRRIGVRKAIMTTIHAYTATQAIVDSPHKYPRRGRAGAANLVPTSTGAAVATTKALPQYQGLFDGIAIRAPVAVGSIADIVLLTARKTTVEEVNQVFRDEATGEQYRGVLGVTEDPIVSSDIIRDPRASVIDLGMTRVVDGDLLKVLAWYDNEWGYSAQMVREAVQMVGAPRIAEAVH